MNKGNHAMKKATVFFLLLAGFSPCSGLAQNEVMTWIGMGADFATTEEGDGSDIWLGRGTIVKILGKGHGSFCKVEVITAMEVSHMPQDDRARLALPGARWWIECRAVDQGTPAQYYSAIMQMGFLPKN